MGQFNFPDGTSGFVKDSTSFRQLFTSTGLQYSEGQPIRYGSNIQGAASTASNISNYGISSVTASTGGGVNNYTLDAPSAGVEKTIYSLAGNTSDYARVYSGSTATFFYSGSTSGALNIRVGLQGPYVSVTMKGLSTSAWLVTSYVGTVAFTT